MPRSSAAPATAGSTGTAPSWARIATPEARASPGGAGDGLDLRLQRLRAQALLEHERERQRLRAGARHREVVDGPVHRELADRAAREADRFHDEAVGGQREVADEARVAELGERIGPEGRQQEALDQALGRLAPGAMRHRDLSLAAPPRLPAGRLDDPEDPLLAQLAHTTSRSRAKRP